MDNIHANVDWKRFRNLRVTDTQSLLSAYTDGPVQYATGNPIGEGVDQETVFNESDISFESVDNVEVEGGDSLTNSLALERLSSLRIVANTLYILFTYTLIIASLIQYTYMHMSERMFIFWFLFVLEGVGKQHVVQGNGKWLRHSLSLSPCKWIAAE